MQAKYEILSQKYSSLHKAYEGVLRHYKERYKTWKAFKLWLLEEMEVDAGANRKGDLNQNAIQERLKKLFRYAKKFDHALDESSPINTSLRKAYTSEKGFQTSDEERHKPYDACSHVQENVCEGA